MSAAFAVVPYGAWPTRGIAKMPLDALEWPLGRPDRLATGCVSDMAATDHLITYPRKPMFYLPWFGVRAQVSVMIVEPDSNHAHHLKSARRLHWRFHRVLTKNKATLAAVPNGIRFVAGDTFLSDFDQIDTTKSKDVSLIASARNDLEGHKLRHSVVERIRATGLDVDILGRGYAPFELKEDGLAPYRYSVVIENSREPSYFTEKLIDALICETVPIYWGAPDIAEYFDATGLMICSDADDIIAALARISPDDYAARADTIAANRAVAMNYANTNKRAAEAVRGSLT
ncbi:glycosyl transferase family 10 (putative fucosyltransferase) [Litoreibacter ponti]|uniref:Glycosyl transferase family 10 (Putative fucosyltransferase) n=1 Tax=Litoreibacter ponti TaxID=1510457 RepID=A0A2T6BL67_9RHOB|nr:glycosyltransferase family 10 [Litoreibacter ponti]PTX56801.1 glycosyl transferase family 10 (putative fucosyltransferase) [Litoreibacter ponti]